MNELDMVRLIKDFNGITAGTTGTIVLKYDDLLFEVEFFDADGDTIDVITTPADVIESVRKL